MYLPSAIGEREACFGHLVDPRTNDVIQKEIIDGQLHDLLKANGVDLDENFDQKTRLVYFLVITGVLYNVQINMLDTYINHKESH